MGSCLGKFLTKKKKESTAVVPPNVVRGQPVVRLFGSLLCPFTSRIQIALQYKCVNVQTVWLTSDDLVGNNKLEMFASISPDLKLPILQHGLDTVFGSPDAILHYIEQQFPNPCLFPDGPLADITLNWVVYVRDVFTPLIGQVLYDGNPLLQRELFPKLQSSFARLNSGMMEYSNRGPYFLGNLFSMVDVYLIPFLYLIFPLEHFRGIGISSAYPYLQIYSRQMLKFPCYSPVRIDLDLLQNSVGRALAERAPPPLVAMTILQHKSLLSHLERLVQCADELAVVRPQGFKTIDYAKGSIGMQIRKLSKNYTHLVDFMQEHAQMEERVIFPALEKADRGITKVADDEHGRDLPIMNGIREDMKSVTALESGSPAHNEALLRVSVRLRTLQAHCMEHFQEEEQSLLPLLGAADLGNKQQEALLATCFSVMEVSHSQLLPYLLSGLQPHEIQQYLEIIQRCQEEDKILHMIQSLRSSGDDSKTAWTIAQKRFPTLIGCGGSMSGC